MQYIFNIVNEPTGITYKKLLSLIFQKCSEFSLVWRNQLNFEKSAYEIEKKLKPFLKESYESDEWPGTKLYGSKGVVRKYRVTKDSFVVLLTVDGFYSWLSPKFPEDITFYKRDGNPWLVTITHEREAYIQDCSIDIAKELNYELPELEIRIEETN